MVALIEKVSSGQPADAPVTREQLRAAARPKIGRPKAYVFQYRPPNKAFNLKLNFRKSDVPKEEVIQALESILEELRRS